MRVTESNKQREKKSNYSQLKVKNLIKKQARGSISPMFLMSIVFWNLSESIYFIKGQGSKSD